MALNKESIQAVEALNGLDEAQIEAIEKLSKNDESVVVGKAIGDLHQKYDDDIKAITGVEKGQGVKSYDHLKGVLTEYKTKADEGADLQGQIATQLQTIEDLKKTIKEGKGDDSIRQDLKDAQDKVKLLEEQAITNSEAWATEKEGLEKANTDTKLKYSFSGATSDLTFKPEYPEDVQKVLIESAQSSILGEFKPEWTEDGKLQFRNAEGEIARNPANSNEPYTVNELVTEKLGSAVQVGKQQLGVGTKPPKTQNPTGPVSLSGCKTQAEADKVIHADLMARGITAGSAEYDEQSMQMKKDANVFALDIK